MKYFSNDKCISWFTCKCHMIHKCKCCYIYFQTNEHPLANHPTFVNNPAYIWGFFTLSWRCLIYKCIYKDILCSSDVSYNTHHVRSLKSRTINADKCIYKCTFVSLEIHVSITFYVHICKIPLWIYLHLFVNFGTLLTP